MPGRNGHPAFGIEIKRRSALKHPEILCSYALRSVFFVILKPTNKHFFTLPPTLEDAR
jgi:hypothetical protein